MALLVFLPLGGLAEGPTYKFGVVPQFEARELASIWVPILAELSRRSGLQLTMEGSPRIPDFEIAFERGDFDFAFMNPDHASRAMRHQGYVPLVRDGGTPLVGVLVVRKDSPYRHPVDLKGKRIAFPAPNSLAASLVLRSELVTRHKIDFVPLYSQTHTSAYLNTVLGVTEASGGVRSSLARQRPEIRDRLRVIHETRALPSHPVVANPRVPPQHRQRVQKAFLDLGATAEGAALLARIPITRVVIPTRAEYAELETWHLERQVSKSDD